jgi:hypothetical protein
VLLTTTRQQTPRTALDRNKPYIDIRFSTPGLAEFGGWVNFGSNRHLLVLFANQKSISSALGRICRSSVRNCADSHAPYRCCHSRAVTQRGLSRLVGRDQRRGNEFDTLARGQPGA